ncbi:hypothetical protein GCM10010503_40260 [Streptomyces lucensis JCM 4490]|uniref:Uncharacterized protein n=1 Tax=Streptomyces lucensis JCM 4490 TaxID=1306176 RepID=A0A918MTK3_9ACTN|nr:hypothetical protein [Streptomyces lucensis]GGW59056.1 hypothetical protein GCM10010503_40260 [Streptomyces lucensis JCM 4490]
MERMVDCPLLSLRSALVLLLALLSGAAAGGLTAVGGEGTARSLLAGLAVTGLAVPFFNRIIAAEAGAAQRPAPAGVSAAEGESNG